MRIIEVSQPTFLVNMRFGRIAVEDDNESDTKAIHSKTYPVGFPRLNRGDVLFKYTDHRGLF